MVFGEATRHCEGGVMAVLMEDLTKWRLAWELVLNRNIISNRHRIKSNSVAARRAVTKWAEQ